MTWVAVAIGGSALIAGGASIYAGSQAAGAAKEAAHAQADAATIASDRALAQYTDTKGNLKPFIAAGTESLDTAKNLLGLDGGGGANSALAQSTLESTPGFAFVKDQGLKSVQNSYAAQGLGSSGAALKGAAQFATGLANTTYEQRLQDYLGLAGSGQQAAEAQGQQGITSTGQANAYSTGGAAATAGGIVGGTNALNAGITGAASGLGNAGIASVLVPQILSSQNTNTGNSLAIDRNAMAKNAGLDPDIVGTALSPGR